MILLVFTLNFYFLSHLSADQSGGSGGNAIDGSSGRQSKSSYMHQVRKKVKLLKPNYLNRNPRFYGVRNQIWRNFELKPYENVSAIWDITYWVSVQVKFYAFFFFLYFVCIQTNHYYESFLQWPNNNEIYPAVDSTMGQLLHALQHEEIIAARNAPKGTQMKLLLQLAGKQKVIFKPKWYTRNAIIDGPVYSGKDRFNAEIVAFYLGAMLNLRWTPIAVGRQINLKEIYEKFADKMLRSTMTVNGRYA